MYFGVYEYIAPYNYCTFSCVRLSLYLSLSLFLCVYVCSSFVTVVNDIRFQPLLVENMIKIDERKLVYEEPDMIQTRSRVLEKRKREEEAKKKAKKGRVVVI